jgi:hypothetical protein
MHIACPVVVPCVGACCSRPGCTSCAVSGGACGGGACCPGSPAGPGGGGECCSAAGTCGGTLDTDPTDVYCGTGCQAAYGLCGTFRRRSTLEASATVPLDVMFGAKQSVFEIFAADTHDEAQGVCEARGASLASYNAVESSVVVDMICEDKECWVGGATDASHKCPVAVDGAVVQQDCGRALQFVCQRAATTEEVDE